MYKKILVAEDFQDTNLGIVGTLGRQYPEMEIQEELYCDRAFNRLKVAHGQNEPFSLLITDLFFKQDHVERKLTSGIELIRAAKKLHGDIKIIVNSMEDDPKTIKSLFDDEKINAYVCKGRHGLKELLMAIEAIQKGRNFVSPQIEFQNGENVFELDDFDMRILKDLANGLTKKEISENLKLQNITPNSESTIDKKVSKLFDEFGARNTHHLIAKLVREGKI
ncbi:MAG: response regulator [Pseudozobellia sp.]|nr:response regulator [Pseudozobellia sp.]MBG47814.1 response regulator [Pseudozobellia sp.]|tara:strand:- start:196 stop:861 length:666 start_codon:yes stop_codon:yes gene_type:complete